MPAKNRAEIPQTEEDPGLSCPPSSPPTAQKIPHNEQVEQKPTGKGYAYRTCSICDKKIWCKSLSEHRWTNHREESVQQLAVARNKKLAELAQGNRHGNTPLAKEPSEPPGTVKEKIKEPKGPPPTGLKEIADLRSRMVPVRLYSDTIYLDTSVVIFYDLTRLKDPEYKKTFAEWITEVVQLFYHEHRHDFGIENLFGGPPQQI